MSYWALSVIFAILTVVSVLFNYLFLIWTRTLGSKNMRSDEQIRWSKSYKPAIGGISFYIVFLISYLIYLYVQNPDLTASEERSYVGILMVVSLGFFVGLADDAFNTVPWLKFSAQVLCGLLLVAFDVQIIFFDSFLPDALLTVFWTVAVMNSINMLDNMDGITSIVTIFILAAAAGSASPLLSSNIYYTFICGGTVAAVLGFLFFNWHPSQIFMGDTGSQMLGGLLAAVGIIFFWNNPNMVVEHAWWSKITIVATAFVLPIGDSLTVTVNRLMRGQSPFVGGRDHTTHHLSYAGLSDAQVALVFIIIASVSLGLIVLLQFIPSEMRGMYIVFMGVYALVTIAFLYSTTRWKRARSIYLEKHRQ